jgi:dsRNA-specific ribonuclease
MTPPAATAHDQQPKLGADAPQITEEMIEAGVAAYRALDREFEADERIVSDVFQAMAQQAQQAQQARQSRREVSSDRQPNPQSLWWLP